MYLGSSGNQQQTNVFVGQAVGAHTLIGTLTRDLALQSDAKDSTNMQR